jgi:hypothetical protein
MQRTVAVWFVLQQYDAYCFCVCSILRSTGYALQTPLPIRIISPQYAAYWHDTMHTVAYWVSTMRTVTVRCVLYPLFFSPRFWLPKNSNVDTNHTAPIRCVSYQYDTYCCSTFVLWGLQSSLVPLGNENTPQCDMIRINTVRIIPPQYGCVS